MQERNKIQKMFMTKKGFLLYYLYFPANRDKILSQISRDTHTTTAYIFHTFKFFEKMNFITAHRIGRTQVFKLTEKGKELSELFYKLTNALNGGIKND